MIPAEAAQEIPIAWSNLTLSWNAVCSRCKECLFMLPHEGRTKPDRPHVQHVCFGKWKAVSRG